MSSNSFARALTYYLALRGKNQQDLINDLGYSSSTVSQWCTGKTVPRMNRIEQIAQYLNIDTSDLMRDPEIFNKDTFTSDPALIAKLLDSKPALYDLFKQSVPLSDTDLMLLTGIAKRINELQE